MNQSTLIIVHWRRQFDVIWPKINKLQLKLLKESELWRNKCSANLYATAMTKNYWCDYEKDCYIKRWQAVCCGWWSDQWSNLNDYIYKFKHLIWNKWHQHGIPRYAQFGKKKSHERVPIKKLDDVVIDNK